MLDQIPIVPPFGETEGHHDAFALAAMLTKGPEWPWLRASGAPYPSRELIVRAEFWESFSHACRGESHYRHDHSMQSYCFVLFTRFSKHHA